MWRNLAMSTFWVLLVGLTARSAGAQASFKVSPSIGNGGITFPLFSGGQRKDQWASESSSSSSSASHQMVTVVPPPDKSYEPFLDGFHPVQQSPHLNLSQTDYITQENYLREDYSKGTYPRVPSYAPAPKDSRNHTSRFFTVNTSRQTLDLGVSFTVPFLSIPMNSLLNIGQNIGENTYTALNSLMAVNWPSVVIIAAAVLGASFLLPQLATLFTSMTGGSSYTTSYGRTISREGTAPLPVEPISSILNQLDDALAQYDLDSTSCMQRAVCSYVSGSEESVIGGQPDASELIITGLARSPMVQSMLGQSAIAKAVELGRKDGRCQRQFPKCPFSIGGVLRFLATYASMTSSKN